MISTVNPNINNIIIEAISVIPENKVVVRVITVVCVLVIVVNIVDVENDVKNCAVVVVNLKLVSAYSVRVVVEMISVNTPCLVTAVDSVEIGVSNNVDSVVVVVVDVVDT